MFIYFLIFVLMNHNAEAAPILADSDRADVPQDSKSPLELKRTLFGVIWSCISTIIVCAWTSVHPNVPPPNRWKALWNRLRLMFWMIVAPELVLAWAVRQSFAAREIRDTYNERHPGLPKWRKWTLAHGHFFGMGGFTLVNPDRRDAVPNEQQRVVLTIDYFQQKMNIDIPEITAADIEDRSKGDALWKTIAILQTTWFILQCIARGQQQLALTELELVTLALASLNAATFAIWWHKPLGVQEPVRIYLPVGTEARKVEDVGSVVDRNLDLSFGDVVSRGLKDVKVSAILILQLLLNLCADGPSEALIGLFIPIPILLTYIITFPFLVVFPLGIILFLRIIETEPVSQETSQSRGLLAARIIASLQRLRYRLGSAVGKFVGRWLKKIFGSGGGFIPALFGWFIVFPSLFLLLLLFLLLFIPFLTLLFVVSFIFTATFDIVTTSTIPLGASHVPSFYAPNTKSDRWSRMVVFALFGVVFGGLHCIGWFFKYPTHPEQTLWQCASLAITVIPLIVAPIDFLLATRDIHSCQRFERRALLFLDLIMTILLFIYVPARLSLLAQALALLRNQPSSALVAVDWTKFVPHLFS